MFSIILVELLIGLTSGVLLTILFSASSLAGEKIAASTGLSFAGLIDPESGTQTPVISQILSLFMIVVFLSLDGHLLALSVILESYKVLPIGATNINMSMIQLGIDAGGLMFKFGALIMLPVVVGITLKCGDRNSYEVCSDLKFIFFWFPYNNVICILFIICM